MKRLIVGDTFQIVCRVVLLIFSDHVDVVITRIWLGEFHRRVEAEIFIWDLDLLISLRIRVFLLWLTRVFKVITPSRRLDIFDPDFRAFWRSVSHHVVVFATWFSQGIPNFSRDWWIFMLL